MGDLAALQRAFAQALDAPSVDDADLAMLAGDPALVRRRFALYRANQQANLLRALRNAYPVLARTLGEDAFAALALDYGAAHRSRDGDLNLTGDRLASFAALPTLLPHGWPAALAGLEWAVHRAHYAADVPPLDVQRLARVPSERYGDLVLAAAPGVAPFRFDWNLASLWNACTQGERPIDVVERVEHALVTRPRHRVIVRVVTTAEHACLCACLAGATMEQAVDAALRLDAAFAFGEALARWVADRTIVDARLAG